MEPRRSSLGAAVDLLEQLVPIRRDSLYTTGIIPRIHHSPAVTHTIMRLLMRRGTLKLQPRPDLLSRSYNFTSQAADPAGLVAGPRCYKREALDLTLSGRSPKNGKRAGARAEGDKGKVAARLAACRNGRHEDRLKRVAMRIRNVFQREDVGCRPGRGGLSPLSGTTMNGHSLMGDKHGLPAITGKAESCNRTVLRMRERDPLYCTFVSCNRQPAAAITIRAQGKLERRNRSIEPTKRPEELVQRTRKVVINIRLDLTPSPAQTAGFEDAVD